MGFYHLLKVTEALHRNRNYGPKHLYKSRVIPVIEMAASCHLCRKEDECRGTSQNFH